MATLSASRQKALLRKYARNIKYFMMLLSVCLIVYTLPKQAKFRYEYEKGRIWNQKDLISPYNFAILKTSQELAADQEAALHSITARPFLTLTVPPLMMKLLLLRCKGQNKNLLLTGPFFILPANCMNRDKKAKRTGILN